MFSFKVQLFSTFLALATATAHSGKIELDFISSVFIPGRYDNGTGVFWLESGALEQIAVDPAEKLVYAIGDRFIHIIDITNPEVMTIIHKEDFKAEMTDVIICGDYVFVSRDDKINKLEGEILVFEKYNKESKTLTKKESIAVGSLPDMMKASSNCSIIVVAVEGEPFVSSDTGHLVDPEGGVVIIRYDHASDNFTKTDLDFKSFNPQADKLIAAGLRKCNPNVDLSKDLEPEYIDFNEDYSAAYVCLQENNAIAEVDLIREKITHIYPLGYKAWKNFKFDSSDKDGGVNLTPWPVYGMFQPDAIHYATSNGIGYIITANEGDSKEYDDVVNSTYGGFSDAMRGKSLVNGGKTFDFPIDMMEALNDKKKLGRLVFSTINGLNDAGDGYNSLYTFGGRSFSIIRADTMEMVYDSGRDLEAAIAEQYPYLFNGAQDAEETIAQSKDTRSDNKGPEAEGLEVADVFGKHVVFVGIERPGLIAVYSYGDDIMDIEMESLWANIPNKPDSKWGDLFKNRDLSSVEPEDMKFISAEQSPNGKPLLLVAGNMCGSLSALEIKYTPPAAPVITEPSSASKITSTLLATSVIIFVQKLL